LAGKDGYLLAFLYNGLATIAGRKLDLMRLSEIYSRSNRKTFLIVGATLIVGIAIVDTITPSLPLGYLYLYSYLFHGWFSPAPANCSSCPALRRPDSADEPF